MKKIEPNTSSKQNQENVINKTEHYIIGLIVELLLTTAQN